MPNMFGHGTTCLWGYSKAIDLNEYGTNSSNRNFFILGASDARHVITTVSRLYRHESQIESVNFYILEPSATAMVRNLLFLNLMWNYNLELGISEKAEVFLELYGNTLIRDRTWHLIKGQAIEIIRLVNGESHLSNNFDFSRLKYRERDDLESVCKYWKDDSKKFEAEDLWRRRMQQYFGQRYDSRENIVDWDYQMKDKKSLSILSRSEYINWRLTGNAFEFRNAALTKTNKTLATVDIMKEHGLGVLKWGYFSDIIMGPFICYGIDTEEKDLLKTQNDKHIKTSQDISAHNISSLIYEFEHQEKMQQDQLAEIKEVDNSLEKVKVHFLPCDPSYVFSRKKKEFEQFFDCVFIANSLAHRIKDAAALIKEKGCILVETAKFMPDLSKEQRDLFVEKELSMATEAKLVCVSSIDDAKASDFIKLVNS